MTGNAMNGEGPRPDRTARPVRGAEEDARRAVPPHEPHPGRRALLETAAAVALALVAAAAAAWVSGRDDGDPSLVRAEIPGDATPGQGRHAVVPAAPDRAAARLFGREAVSRFDASPVPVLAPSSLAAEEAAAFAKSFRATPDGWFARAKLADYDLVLNGTRAYVAAPPDSGARPRDTDQVAVSETETGLQATFSRYGASYRAELACRGPGGVPCVTEDEARALVDKLVVVGGGED